MTEVKRLQQEFFKLSDSERQAFLTGIVDQSAGHSEISELKAEINQGISEDKVAVILTCDRQKHKDLKHGPDINGSIGLWVGPGTEAYFSELYVTKTDQ